MSKESKKLTIVHLNYDWRDICRTNPSSVVEKLKRDQFDPEKDNFFIVSWGTDSYEMQLSKNIFTVHLKAHCRKCRPLYDFLMWWKLPNILKKHNVPVDYFFVHDVGMYMATLRARKIFQVPSLLFLSNIPDSLLKTRTFSRVRSFYQKIIERIVRGKIDHVFAISEAVASYGERLEVGKKNIHYFAPQTIPENIEEKLSSCRGEMRKRYNVSTDTPVLLTVSRLEPEKRVDSILRSFSKLDYTNMKLVIVGEGILKTNLQELAEDLGITDSVIFAGNVPHDELWGYYADSSVFMIQSSSEALGLVVWEAMVSGLPVITSRAEGFLESVGDEERGYLWEENDGINALRDKIDWCIARDNKTLLKIARAKEYITNIKKRHIDLKAI